MTYTNGDCSVSTITGEGAATNTYVYDSFTNPSKTVFSDQYLLTLFDSDNNDEVGSVIAIFHSTNNWIRLEADQGNVDFNVTYDAENKITSRNGNFDLGDGISVSQSETFQY